MNTTSSAIQRGPRSALVPLLLVISSVLLSTVALVQGRTIHSQRSLIRVLLQGHVERSGLTPKIAASHAGTLPPANQAQARELSPHPSPSTQVPAVKPPVTVKPGHKARRAQGPSPAAPPAELSDPLDTRRVSFSI